MTTTTTRLRAGFAGAMAANSLPHLASAVCGKTHLTPLAWRNSNRWVNLAWGCLNLGAGLALIASRRTPGDRWDVQLPAFEIGAAAFATWMALSEGLKPFNHHPD